MTRNGILSKLLDVRPNAVYRIKKRNSYILWEYVHFYASSTNFAYLLRQSCIFIYDNSDKIHQTESFYMRTREHLQTNWLFSSLASRSRASQSKRLESRCLFLDEDLKKKKTLLCVSGAVRATWTFLPLTEKLHCKTDYEASEFLSVAKQLSWINT